MKRLIFTGLSLVILVLAACTGAGENANADSVEITPLAPTSIEAVQDTEDNASEVELVTDNNDESQTDETVARAATPTPQSNGLAPGESRAIAQATDVAMQPTPRGEPMAFDENPVALRFADFYEGFDIRRGLILSDKLVSLDGQDVVIEGYMAPPLKPALDWFVLTRVQLALCPFCSTDADWPNDIALVYMPDGETVEVTGDPLRVYGRLEVGSSVDAETGMVSVVRVYVEELEEIQ